MNYPRNSLQDNGLDGRHYKSRAEELDHWLEQHPQADYWRVPSYLKPALKEKYGDIRTAKLKLGLADRPHKKQR